MRRKIEEGGNMRTRKETNYRNNALSKTGTFSPRISVATTNRIIRYCKETNQNKTRFVEKCVNERLDDLEKEMLNEMSKEQLIEMLMRG